MKGEKKKMSNICPHIPIHFVYQNGALTACGLSVSMQMAMTGNVNKTSCRRCVVTKVWKRAIANMPKHKVDGVRFKQPELW